MLDNSKAFLDILNDKAVGLMSRIEMEPVETEAYYHLLVNLDYTMRTRANVSMLVSDLEMQEAKKKEHEENYKQMSIDDIEVLDVD